MKVLVLFYSTYGHIYKLAQAIEEGVKKAGVDVDIKRVKETFDKELLEKIGATESIKEFEHIEIAEKN